MKHTQKALAILAALFVMIGIFSVAGASAAASAQDTAHASSDAQSSDNCEDYVDDSDEEVDYFFTTCTSAESEVIDKSKGTSKAATTADGRLILSFVMPDGLPKADQERCDTIPAGTRYTNDYRDSLGRTHWKVKTAGPGGVRICFDGKVWRVVKCGNRVIWKQIHKAPKPYRGKVKIVQQQKLWGNVKAEAEGVSKSEVKAVQKTGACAGSHAYAFAEGSFVARASARVRGSSASELKSEIEAAKARLEYQVRQQAIGNAAADAMGKVRTKVQALIVCNEQPDEEVVTGDLICANPPHLYAPNGNGIMVCELSRSDNVKPQLSQFSIQALNDHAYFAQPTEYGYREAAAANPCPTNVLCVRVQVWANSPGLFKYRATFAQYDQVDGQFRVEQDDF